MWDTNMFRTFSSCYVASAKLILTKTIVRHSSMTLVADIPGTQIGRKAKTNGDSKPEGWDKARPFESIPGPKPLPLVGNIWRFFPYIGDFYNKSLLDIQKILHEKYGNIASLKGALIANDIVMIFAPDDIEAMHRNEGLYPIKNILKAALYHRSKLRADVFQGVNGIICEGQEWYNFRTKVNPILMQPKAILQYVNHMDYIASDFLKQVRQLSLQNPNGEMSENFMQHIYKWALESIAFVALDKRIGCLDPSTGNTESQIFISNILKMFNLMYKIEFLPSLWKSYSNRTCKEYFSLTDSIISTSLKYIDEAKQKLEDQNKSKSNSESEKSILQQLLEVDIRVALPMSIDLLIAGVDTTGKVAGAGLYYLAKNPDVQDKLRQEMRTLLPLKDTPLTKEVLAKASYLKATVKEILRLAPIAAGNLRETTKDLVFQGYQIPRGTSVFTSSLLHCHSDKHFAKASEFIPDRWLRSTSGELSHKNAHPFIYLPYGFGPRSCVGMRLANLELEILTAKIIRNFSLEWHYDDMVFETNPFYGIAKPLKIRIKEIEE